MASLPNRLLSLLFFWSWQLRTGRWVIGVLILWWGWILWETNPARGGLLWGIDALFLLFTMVAQACSYVMVRRDPRSAPNVWQGMPERLRGRATGFMTRSSFFGLDSAFGFNVAVQLRWGRAHRPPFLMATHPEGEDPERVRYGDGLFAEWYAGSQVERVWFWAAGREAYGLRISFAGRWLLLELDETDAAVVEQLLVS